MSVSRKRFRVEQAIVGDMPIQMPGVAEGDVGPMHREIMAELRAIRAQMAAPVRSGAPESTETATSFMPPSSPLRRRAASVRILEAGSVLHLARRLRAS